MSGVLDGVIRGDEELAPGTTVGGRYRIEALIGAGGMARVYRAFDTELERTLAIKVLSALRAGPDFVRRFRREVSLALRITHPNVIRLFDLGTAEVRFLTMELVEGMSLRAHKQARGPLPIAEACEIARQTALGLAAAHAAGVVHRDLKPENILITGTGRVVVCDFGVAGEAAQLESQASAIVGTSAYMAPEQANGEVAAPRVDLYALGLVLYEILTGEVPLTGTGAVSTALRREKEVPPAVRDIRPDVPAAIELLIARLLAADPAQRPESATVVAEALAEHADPHALQAPTPQPTPVPFVPPQERATRVVPRPRRRRLVPILGAAALVAVAAWLIVPRLRTGQPAPPPPAKISPTRPILFTVGEGDGKGLPADARFLAAALPEAAYRALAYQLPGRIALPGVKDDGAIAVRPELGATDAGFICVLHTADHSARGDGKTVADALDAAADTLVRLTFPDGVPPTPDELADARAWGASSPDVVRRYRRAVISCGRLRHEKCIASARALEEARFLRPLILEVVVVGDDSVVPDDLAARAQAALASGAPDVPLLGAAMPGTNPEERMALAAERPDVWQRYLRAWALAYAGKFDEAFAVTDELALVPELAGIGLWQAYLFARYYVDSREDDVAQAMTQRLPEEPVAWIELARVAVSHDNLDGAAEAIRRARAVGASAMALADVESQLAIARFELDLAAQLGRRLLSSDSSVDRVAGHETLYAVDVLAGNFEQARRRMPDIVRALAQAGDYHSPTDALELAQDAFARGEPEVSSQFFGAVVLAGDRLNDAEYQTSATTKRAAVDLASGRIDEAAYKKITREAIERLVARGFDSTSREYQTMAQVLVDIGRGRCDVIRQTARGIATPRPILTLALARCDLAGGDPARALARLGPLFEGHGRRNYPTLAVLREHLLGKSLVALGRKDEARVHLERVVTLWRDAPDSGEVTEALRLLEK